MIYQVKNKSILIIFLSMTVVGSAQTYNDYEISFENAVHHEANIKARFTNLPDQVLEIRMSRTSPGRYAIHEFAKNVYSVKATDGTGKTLNVTRANPYQWNISNHGGEVNFEYTLYANRAGGTYSGIDETHAHLNIPATFVFARNLESRPVRVKFNVRADLKWMVATQMKPLGDNSFYAPDTDYFMDSPAEIANYYLREETLDGQNIRWVLHKLNVSDGELDKYFSGLMEIVRQQKAVYGELPAYDFNEYTFLSCYMPNASGDGMEHRNSTYVVGSNPVDQTLGFSRIGTISHEFFHCWNVERLRPKSLEPFDFEEANMSGELWFAEGFTSYYTQLILTRAGLMSNENYVRAAAGAAAFVINSPGDNYFNPIEMSYQAPFVDAATSVDPINRSNTFISYYTYGHALALALDLSLGTNGSGLSLDGYMKLAWEKYGKEEIPYTVRDLQGLLSDYAGSQFATEFYENHIFKSTLPDFKRLFKNMGVDFRNEGADKAYLGNSLTKTFNGWQLTDNAMVGGPLYNAGIEKEDIILRIGDKLLDNNSEILKLISAFKPGDEIEVEFVKMWGERRIDNVKLTNRSDYVATIDPRSGKDQSKLRATWLSPK